VPKIAYTYARDIARLGAGILEVPDVVATVEVRERRRAVLVCDECPMATCDACPRRWVPVVEAPPEPEPEPEPAPAEPVIDPLSIPTDVIYPS